jgi:hypothetical protein
MIVTDGDSVYIIGGCAQCTTPIVIHMTMLQFQAYMIGISPQMIFGELEPYVKNLLKNLLAGESELCRECWSKKQQPAPSAAFFSPN